MRKRTICNTAQAKVKLNEYLHDVERGDEVIIQRRGKVVAKLVPMTGDPKDDRGETIRFMGRLRGFQRGLRARHGKDSSTVELLRELRKES